MSTKKQPSPKVRYLLKKGLSLNQSLNNLLVGLETDKTIRKTVALACFDQAIEHHLAICRLFGLQLNGSAFALLRPTFEGFVRGVWLLNCASDKQLNDYLEDNMNLGIATLINQIEKSDSFKSGVLNQVVEDCWSSMCSYTHTGIMQASRRHTNDTIEPDYKDKEIIEVLRIAGSSAFLAFQQIAFTTGKLEVANEATGLLVAHISNHKI